ncbi:MAG: copper homeostasis protein CutC, partial [Bacteroidales bacterium]|nr:copper homeostasis protein CutC [Bacteroidales bacterium]
ASGFSAADFVYDKAEIDQMIADIEFCKTVGVAGIVVGALTPEGAIDREVMRRLIAAASPLPVTFHRAYDVCTADPFIALDQIIALGCTRLLTSGQAPTAWDGRGVLALLVRRAGRRLIVMPGCGVKPDNLAALAAITHATEFHGTSIP